MAKVHPNSVMAPQTKLPKLEPCCSSSSSEAKTTDNIGEDALVLTVWRKSLLFNCNGFTVYDCKGNLVFRVDSYGSRSKSELVLMDASGKPLMTLRRKKLSFSDNWLVYNGEESGRPLFSVKKHMTVNLRHHSKTLAHVSSLAGVVGRGYDVVGTYCRRSCAVYDENRRVVAEIKQKEAAVCGAEFGGDVFRLVVRPELDATLAMAVVIALDQIFESRGNMIIKS